MNFLADYMFYNSGNEASPDYHLWCGLATLSSVMNRRVWIDRGYFNVYPTLYIVLLGEPGGGKTTAMSVAKGLVRDLGDVPFSAECQSKEKLVAELATYERTFEMPGGQPPLVYTPMSCFVTELSQFIGIDPAKMIDFLVTVYDQDWYDQKTQKHGTQTIVGPGLNVLACTTPEWVTRYLKSDVITGGFSRRTIFVLADEPYGPDVRIPEPTITDEQRAAYLRLTAYLRELQTVAGKFDWAPEAREWYNHWYKYRDISREPTIAMFDKRLPMQVLKIAMLMSLSCSTKLVMGLDALQAAKAAVDKVLARLPEVFRGLGRNELNQVAAKIVTMLKANGPMPEKRVLTLMFSEANIVELTNVIMHLTNTNQLLKFRDDKTDPPRIILALPEHRKGKTNE